MNERRWIPSGRVGFRCALALLCLGAQAAFGGGATKQPAHKPTSRYHLKVSVAFCRMWLYEGDAIRKSYRVATCRRGEPSPEGDGTIWAVSFKPTWYPTKNTREYYKKKKRINLPEVVPYGDPNNPLGDFKMSLSHPCDATGLRVYAIHGTPDKSSIGKRASGGCIRMLPDEGLELAKLINAELQAGNQVHVIVTDATVKVVKTPNAMMVPDPFRPEPIATRSAARTSAVTTSVPITPVTIPSAFVSAPTLAGSPR